MTETESKKQVEEVPRETPAHLFSGLMQHVLQGATLDAVLNSVFENFDSFLPYNRIGCALVDESGENVTARWCRSDRPVFLNASFSAPLKGSSLQIILEQRRPRILNNLEEYLKNHPNSAATRLIVREGYRSSFTFPLVAEGHGIGFLFFSSIEVDAYSEAHYGLFGEIAGLLSMGILLASQRERAVRVNAGYMDLLNTIVRAVDPISEQTIHLVFEVGQALCPEHVKNFETGAVLTEVSEIISANEEGEEKSLPRIVSGITELETASAIVALHDNGHLLSSSQSAQLCDEPLVLGANLIKTVRQFKKFEHLHSSSRLAIEHLRREPEVFAPMVVDQLERILSNPADVVVRRVMIEELVDGMVFKEHVVTSDGAILLSSNHIVNEETKRRLKNFTHLESRVMEPLLVLCKADNTTDEMTSDINTNPNSPLSAAL